MGGMLTKQWFFSAKVFTTLILIIFPVCYLIMSIFAPLSLPFRIMPFPDIGIVMPIPIPIAIPPIPLLVVLLAFAVYPALYPTPKFFKKRGFENVLIEYYYIKKILFFAIIIMIVLLPMNIILLNRTDEFVNNDETTKDLTDQMSARADILIQTGKPPEEISKDKEIMIMNQRLESIISQNIPLFQFIGPFYESIFIVLPISISIIVKLVIQHSRKLFKLYLAKACIGIVLKEVTNELDKAKYFMTGLMWYSRFLKRIINLEINNIDTFFESVLTKAPFNNNPTLESIGKTFEKSDEFAPLRFLSTILPEENILSRETLTTKIKESSELIIPIVTTLVTLITSFFIKPL